METRIFVCLAVVVFCRPIDCRNESAVIRRAAAIARNVTADMAACDHMMLANGVDKPRTFFFSRHHITKTARNIGALGNCYVNFTTQMIALNESSMKAISEMNDILECPFNETECNSTKMFRTIDGTCNNLENFYFGAANVPFTRFLPPEYDDGVDTPRQRSVKSGMLPSARRVSSTVIAASDSSPGTDSLNMFGVFFGQFLSHDFERFAVQSGEGMTQLDCCASRDLGIVRPQRPCFPIDVPSDDPFFSRFNRTCLNFVRSMPTPQLNCSLGPREQITQVTGFIDASNVYGSSKEEIDFLRTYENGFMRMIECNSDTLPPPDELEETECTRELNFMGFSCFIAGDVRVNENPGLALHHIIWLREHNRIARGLARVNPHWDDERLFQESRRIVIAEMQNIVFGEFLPIIIGELTSRSFGLPPQATGYFTGYDDQLNATPRNEFSAAAFRFGHSMIAGKIQFDYGCYDLDYRCTQEEPRNDTDFRRTRGTNEVCPNNRLSILLRKVFERPDTFYKRATGVDALARGLLLARAQTVDNELTAEVRNHLFEFGKEGHGMDLAALNIQRGRDHGIPPYNEWRVFCGLPRVVKWGKGKGGLVDHSFSVARLLKIVYRDPDDIDLFAGGISEIPYKNSLMGPTFTCMLARQFGDLKCGDRFWFENPSPNPFTPAQLRSIRRIKYSRIVRDNTGLFDVFNDVFRPIDYHRFLKRPWNFSLNLKLWKERLHK